MATINFLYRSTKKSANLNLRLLFRDGNADFVFGAKTKIRVDKEYWEKQHASKRLRDVHLINMQKKLNNEIHDLEIYILSAFEKSDISFVDKEWLVKQVDSFYNTTVNEVIVPNRLVDYITYYIEFKKNELKPASVAKFNVIKNKLERFELKLNNALKIEDVNEIFKKNFHDYCLHENYSTNTIQRELVLIKTFCKHARSNGMKTHPQLDDLKLRKETVEHVYLNFEEIAEIEKVELEHDYLINARDWLVLSCYLGQRISDFMRFNKEMIREEKGRFILEFSQKKTGHRMTILLHQKVIEILDKNDGNFPRPISDQRYNDYIKEVCCKAKLNKIVRGKMQRNVAPEGEPKRFRSVAGEYEKWKLVSSHIGRRSFATNFYGTVPTTLLRNMTGHKSEAMFLLYIGKSNKDLAMELTNYF